MKQGPRRDYWNPYVGGVVLGIVLFLSFLLTGNGLGASGGVARIVLGALQELVNKLKLFTRRK